MSFADAMLSGCNSAGKKAKDAGIELERAQLALAESQKDSTLQADWMAFKGAAQSRISDNILKIAQLMAEKKYNGVLTNASYKNQIKDLEDRNLALKLRMDEYEKYNNNQEAFREDFNQDMDDLGKSLTAFTDKKSK
jgi:hypothetical protein